MTAAGAKWVIDADHTNVEFRVRHLMIPFRGTFEQVEGTIVGDPDDLTNAVVEAKIDAGSVHTRNKDRDAHLRSDDFFAVDEHPHITFRSTEVKKTGDATYDVIGDLTMRGTTLPVTLSTTFTGHATDPWGNPKIGFAAETKINRKDFGLEYNAPLEAGGVLLGDEVTISLELQAGKAE